VFKEESAAGQRRLFGGPLVPGSLALPQLIPFVPDFPGLRFQVLHSYDMGEAIRLAVTGGAQGPFNIAADPVIGPAELARMLGARVVRVPVGAVRAALAAAWQLHLVPADPKLFDLLLRLPVMSTERARTELGWAPRYSATEAIQAFLNGLRSNAGMDTPPLAAKTSGPARSHELGTGVGERP
jgi:nucleoside-diphosphate-sugar epimerase